jgi:hypothetical protein
MSNLTARPFRPQPFGEECCEDEVQIFRGQYTHLFFQHTPFNDQALKPERYLFVGRRGSGKTSLAHYLTFQKKVPHAKCIDVDEPKVYEIVLARIAECAARTSELAMPRIVDIWEFLIWSLVFDELASSDSTIASARLVTTNERTASSLIREILKHLLSLFLRDTTNELSDDLEAFLTSGLYADAQKRALQITESRPLFIAIDSLEKYAVSNEPMMRATAGLIECASRMNRRYAHYGIHVKAFISAEIFPHLEESAVSNPSKYIRKPVYLHWRPKDLMRLASWRLNEYFHKHEEYRQYYRSDVNWENSKDVLDKVWIPRFGEYVVNGNSLKERTFPYVLRHTQLRPRQFVILCNAIADTAFDRGRFPDFSRDILVSAIQENEQGLAGEVLNSYSKVYPNVGDIVRALEGLPMVFDGKLLDRVGGSTASQWPNGDYSQFGFRRILAELGIVGRVRSETDRNVAADFEYAIESTLTLPQHTRCVIHPMFFEKLGIKSTHDVIVHPFPDHPDFHL